MPQKLDALPDEVYALEYPTGTFAIYPTFPPVKGLMTKIERENKMSRRRAEKWQPRAWVMLEGEWFDL